MEVRNGEFSDDAWRHMEILGDRQRRLWSLECKFWTCGVSGNYGGGIGDACERYGEVMEDTWKVLEG